MSEQGFEKWWEDRIKNGLDAANRREYEDAWKAAIAYMQEQSEPVAYTDGKDDFMSLQTYKDYEILGLFNNCTIQLYTKPQRQQPLKRLSKEQIYELPEYASSDFYTFANAIMDEMIRINK